MESESRKEESLVYSNAATKKARLQSTLSALLDDPILSDVPKKPTITDVETLINLEQGSAMKITIVKMDTTYFDIVVLNSSTVKDLKMSFERRTNEIEQGRLGHRHISWRHVWANYCLCLHNEKLLDDNSLLSDCGLQNNSKVHFLPFVASRVFQKHSRRRKHRFFHGLSKRTVYETG
ncbi:hypothetical protein KSP39_PZI000950 [Platanthera zijinensis]|uniref:SNRNP25 ubiquitin-like domain-containing protein n=2 Tax=Platanthera TaxID=59352 RepID=A0AAP0C238_9ASPA